MIPTTASMGWHTSDVDKTPKRSSSATEFPAPAQQARHGHTYNSNAGDEVPAANYKHKLEKVKANPIPTVSHRSPLSIGRCAIDFRHIPLLRNTALLINHLDPINTYKVLFAAELNGTKKIIFQS